MDGNLESERHDLLFATELSVRYHRRRAAFLEAANNLLNLLTLIAGAGAFVSLAGQGTLTAQLLALLVTAIGIVRIVYSPQACAIRHKDWLVRWLTLLREIKLTPAPTSEQLADWTQRRYSVEAECIIEMRALQADCYNRAARALGLSETYNYRIRPWHRLLMQVVRFEHGFEGAPKPSRGKKRFWLFGAKVVPARDLAMLEDRLLAAEETAQSPHPTGGSSEGPGEHDG